MKMRCVGLAVIGLLLVCGSEAQRGGSRSIVRGADLVKLAGEMKSDFAALEKSHLAYRAAAEKALGNQAEFSKKASEVAKLADSLGRGSRDVGTGRLIAESRKMQEMNMSFNMQYLQLQQQMQNENRQFTLLSNIMK